MKLKKKKGFTLIELLIVVAIIAILAAIAIPQFSAYRIRGYNAAADSDLRNMKIALEAFFTDNQVYASTTGCTSPPPGQTLQTTSPTGPGAGSVLLGPVSYTIKVLAGTIAAGSPATDVNMLFGLSNNVWAAVTTSPAPQEGQNYSAFTANKSGDLIFASESGLTALMRSGKTTDGLSTTIAAAQPGGGLAVVPASATQNPATDFGADFVAM